MTKEFWLSRARTLVTLLVLALLVVLAVRWGFNAATAPFPQKAETPPCVENDVEKGDVLRPAAITVSVLNAGGLEGLAGRTLDGLVEQGFGRGDLDNAPDDAQVKSVAILSDDPTSPEVKLLRSYLGGKKVAIINAEPIALGVNVLVNDRFTGVQKGRPDIDVQATTTICSPPDLT